VFVFTVKYNLDLFSVLFVYIIFRFQRTFEYEMGKTDYISYGVIKNQLSKWKSESLRLECIEARIMETR
jgi:hypothetical protein